MFARPPAAASMPAHAERGDALGRVAKALSNPFVGAGLAGGVFLLAATVLVIATADPRAGAPSVRVKLEPPAKLDAAPMRTALTPDAQAPAGDAALPGQPAADTAPGGQAVITLPNGGKVEGAAAEALRPITAPTRPLGPPLPKAPIAGLTQPGPGGLLPMIGKDGKTPFAAYARPFAGNGKPKIALVVGGLGLNAVATKAAIERLPPEITLSFVPYADGLQAWIDMARSAGHEVILEIPMEPLDYPNNDPGPYTLMAQGAPGETTRRLDWLLSRATGYFAVTNYLGGRFLQTDPAMIQFTGSLKSRGLGFIDDGSARKTGAGGGAPHASADAVIDQDLASDSIDRQLTALEGAALSKGQALGVGFAYPVTVGQVARWTQGLAGRGYQLAPASAVTRK